MSSLSNELSDDIKNEFYVDSEGRVFAKSIRAIARLAGINVSILNDARTNKDGVPRGLLQKLAIAKTSETPIIILPDTLKPCLGFDYTLTASIPDYVVSCIVNYFAWEADPTNDIARMNAISMNSIGFRAWFQKVLGWKEQKQLSLLESLKLNVELEEKRLLLEAEKEKLKNDNLELKTTNGELIEENKELIEDVETYVQITTELATENEELTNWKTDAKEFASFEELLEISRNNVSDYTYPNGVSVSDFVEEWNSVMEAEKDRVPFHLINTIRTRAAQYYRLLEWSDPPKNKQNVTIYAGKKVAYLIATIKLVLRGI